MCEKDADTVTMLVLAAVGTVASPRVLLLATQTKEPAAERMHRCW